MGTDKDVDLAVKAARKAFHSYSISSVDERVALLERILAEYRKRYDDVAAAITEEMGAPAALAYDAQAATGVIHLEVGIAALKNYAFSERRGGTIVAKEPIGVCGLITPWNWPISLIACKVVPALATGCTMVLKPSEIAPFSAYIWAEVLEAAGVPDGVFNLVNGDGPTVGAAIAAHPDVDLVSFTGSTRGGIEVARAAAPTVKRVHQELGGKSPNIILPDADLEQAVRSGVNDVMKNSGQTCNAPTRMLVPNASMEEAIAIAKSAAEGISVGVSDDSATIGPLVSKVQWEHVQGMIRTGIDEGAMVITGGLGKPEALARGFYAKPTVFAKVDNKMTIARDEVFGPVIVLIGYDTVDEAIEIANDSPYGLAAFVSGKDERQLRHVASKLRAGQVTLNSAPLDFSAPFGGFKRSGNGREWGDHAFGEYLETKAIQGVAE